MHFIVQFNLGKIKLDTHFLLTFQRNTAIQQQRTKWHDKFIKNNVFHRGDWELLYDSCFKDFKGKLCSHWIGPYEVDTFFDNGTVRLVTIDDTHASFIINEHLLKLYHHPASKDVFIKHIYDKDGLKVVSAENSSSPSSNYKKIKMLLLLTSLSFYESYY